MRSTELLAAVPSLDWWEVLVRLTVAAVLGAAVGLERELKEHEAGLRTHLLVSVGSALFTLVSAYGFEDFLVAGGAVVRTDPTRIAAQIVTGIGFLGAGAIIRQGFSVRGLTTAATLWLVAGIGMASGAGFYSAAIIGTAGAILTLGPLRYLARHGVGRLRSSGRARLLVEVPAGGSAGPVLDAIERSGGHVRAVEIAQERDRRAVAIEVELSDVAPAAVVAGVGEVDGVLAVRWSE